MDFFFFFTDVPHTHNIFLCSFATNQGCLPCVTAHRLLENNMNSKEMVPALR